jgi:ethanolamine utilization cobalamin adenosyltransferase
MLYTEEIVRANIRNRNGERVFYLGEADRLTPGARDYLSSHKIRLLSADQAKPEEYRLAGGGYVREKPEHMTHLNGDVLVEKTHPRIAFRGEMDALQAEMILCQLEAPQWAKELEELLSLSRELIACEVLDRPVQWDKLLGLTQQQLRSRSHRPQDYYGQPHFMPSYKDGIVIARLNRCRCAARRAELAACRAFTGEEGCTRPDLIQALNRLSSSLYLLMIRQKAEQKDIDRVGLS